MSTSVKLEAVSRRFGAAAPAVDNVALDVGQGEFVTLLGPSGCGKTTTLRMVAGLEHNDEGRIWIQDRLVNDGERRRFVPPEQRGLGMVFQSYAIWPHMTVFENVAYPLRLRRLSAAVVRDKVMAALALVDMTHLAERPAPALSGGQQQRVAIARALSVEPPLLLLDEPLSNLDAKLRTQMGEEFRALQRRLGFTALYVTHDQEEAMALSDRIVVMDKGRIQQNASPREVYQRPANLAVARFVGDPNCLPVRVVAAEDAPAGAGRYRIEGEGWTASCRGVEGLAANQQAVLIVRPEDLQAPRAAEAGANGFDWQGRIVSDTFKGARRTVQMRIGESMLRYDVAAAYPYGVGDEARVGCGHEAGWLVAA
ncbi:MAG: ABC transporter ATP-binding protein [Pigmentiphaga sp.]